MSFTTFEGNRDDIVSEILRLANERQILDAVRLLTDIHDEPFQIDVLVRLVDYFQRVRRIDETNTFRLKFHLLLAKVFLLHMQHQEDLSNVEVTRDGINASSQIMISLRELVGLITLENLEERFRFSESFGIFDGFNIIFNEFKFVLDSFHIHDDVLLAREIYLGLFRRYEGRETVKIEKHIQRKLADSLDEASVLDYEFEDSVIIEIVLEVLFELNEGNLRYITLEGVDKR